MTNNTKANNAMDRSLKGIAIFMVFVFCTSTLTLSERDVPFYTDSGSPVSPMVVQKMNLFILDCGDCKITGTRLMVAFSTQVISYKRKIIG